ncbi:hypothetical protein V7149_16020 [Bacillus sp. JJ1503]|uniref:hypothetical protein n=1 Tax=Bacillus sp. JJ1503 TaxID=3122956 RepID=UPI002FFF64BF
MRIMLDTIEFSYKPQGFEIGAINNRIINFPVEIDVGELADEVVKGKTFAPASFKTVDGLLRRSKKNWESQQVIALDFDEGLTLEEAIRDGFFQNHAVFLYTTFNHSEQHHKFRVVFVLDEPVTNYKDFETIINRLFERYPYADKACKDGSRLFFGGKTIVSFNYDNRLKVDEIISKTLLQDIKSNLNMSDARVAQNHKTAFSNNTHNANNLYLIKTRDIKTLQDAIGVESVTLSKNEVLEYLKKQNLRTFLGVEYMGNFYNVFHEESSPSASIYQSSKGNGHWLYKCHSESNPFTGTILHVVQRILDCSVVEARDFLIGVYKIEIYESKAVIEFKESIDLYKELLRSEELEEIHPNFYRVFNRYGHLKDLYVLLDFAKEFITNNTDPRIIFYHSIRTLANQFGRSTSSTGTRMNFLTLFNVIRKLDESEVPESLLQYQTQNKIKKHYQYRSSTYELPMYTYDFFCQVEEMCRIWLEKSCSSRTISYEGILRTFGEQEADRVFPQDKGKEVNVVNQDVVSQIHLITLKFIEHKGWTTQQEILDSLIYFFKGQQEFKTQQIKRCLGEMLDAYNLEIVSTNKKIKEEMGITEEFMSKYSFPKLIRLKM